MFLEEPEPDEEQNYEAQSCKRAVLLEEQLPVDAHGRPAVLLAVVAQAAADLAHPLEAVPAVEQVLDVLGHDLSHVPELVVELVEVLAGARVGVHSFRLADEAVKLHEGVGPQGRRVDLVGRVGGGELARQVGQVGEGELARVRAVADAEERNIRVDGVVEGEGAAAVDGGLGLGGACEFAEDLAGLLLYFCEGGLGLLRKARVRLQYSSSRYFRVE